MCAPGVTSELSDLNGLRLVILQGSEDRQGREECQGQGVRQGRKERRGQRNRQGREGHQGCHESPREMDTVREKPLKKPVQIMETFARVFAAIGVRRMTLSDIGRTCVPPFRRRRIRDDGGIPRCSCLCTYN